MKITVLGSGTYQPELDKANSGYLVQINDENLVFDLGRGCINQLLKEGIRYYDIDMIFITHVHADHCSELSSFLHIALGDPYPKNPRKKDVIIYGPKGIKETVGHLLEAFNLSHKRPEYKVEVRELEEGDAVDGKAWLVRCFRAEHSRGIECLSYRIESGSRIFAYSGDSSDCQGLRMCCQDADLAIIEAAYPSRAEKEGHLTGEKAGKAAMESNVKKLALTHIEVYNKKNFDVKKEAESFFKGQVIIAEDLMRFEL